MHSVSRALTSKIFAISHQSFGAGSRQGTSLFVNYLPKKVRIWIGPIFIALSGIEVVNKFVDSEDYNYKVLSNWPHCRLVISAWTAALPRGFTTLWCRPLHSRIQKCSNIWQVFLFESNYVRKQKVSFCSNIWQVFLFKKNFVRKQKVTFCSNIWQVFLFESNS
jgi:hypothetical protein